MFAPIPRPPPVNKCTHARTLASGAIRQGCSGGLVERCELELEQILEAGVGDDGRVSQAVDQRPRRPAFSGVTRAASATTAEA